MKFSLYCVYTHVNSINIESQELFEKCGFQQEGILRNRIFKDGSHHDVYSYSIFKKGLIWRLAVNSGLTIFHLGTTAF